MNSERANVSSSRLELLPTVDSKVVTSSVVRPIPSSSTISVGTSPATTSSRTEPRNSASRAGALIAPVAFWSSSHEDRWAGVQVVGQEIDDARQIDLTSRRCPARRSRRGADVQTAPASPQQVPPPSSPSQLRQQQAGAPRRRVSRSPPQAKARRACPYHHDGLCTSPLRAGRLSAPVLPGVRPQQQLRSPPDCATTPEWEYPSRFSADALNSVVSEGGPAQPTHAPCAGRSTSSRRDRGLPGAHLNCDCIALGLMEAIGFQPWCGRSVGQRRRRLRTRSGVGRRGRWSRAVLNQVTTRGWRARTSSTLLWRPLDRAVRGAQLLAEVTHQPQPTALLQAGGTDASSAPPGVPFVSHISILAWSVWSLPTNPGRFNPDISSPSGCPDLSNGCSSLPGAPRQDEQPVLRTPFRSWRNVGSEATDGLAHR
jgi:hypothetical protein